MALTKPILYSQVAFDATQSHTFSFNVIGGTQVVSNRLTITNQESNVVVYESTQTTYGFIHEVPANTLVNGTYYSASIVTIDAQGNFSVPSAPIQFYCYSTPSFAFSNIPVSRLIGNSSYSFEISYDQGEGEKLSSFIVTLYDAQRTPISSSGTQYVGDSVLPTTLSYTFTGLNNNTNYYIQATGVTTQGTQISTAQESITVLYIQPNLFSVVQLTNNCKGGYVVVKSNLTAINGVSEPDPPHYVKNNTAVDATSDGEYVQWSQGYDLGGDFTASLWGYNFNYDEPIITFESQNNSIVSIVLRHDDEGKIYAECTVIDGNIIYFIYSDSVEITDDDSKIQIWLQRVGEQYEIKIANLGVIA